MSKAISLQKYVFDQLYLGIIIITKQNFLEHNIWNIFSVSLLILSHSKGSETLKIPVYTLFPRHPDLQLLKQALLIKQ